MGYRKYNKRRGRKRRPTAWYNKKYSAKQVAQQALLTANAVRKLINVEFKTHDLADTSTITATTGKFLQLTTIPQGDTAITRDGASVRIKSLNIKGYVTKSASASISHVRLAVVQCMNDSSPSAGLLYENSPYVDSFRNLDYTEDFKIIAQRRFILVTNDNPSQHFEFNIDPSKLKIQHLQWDQTDTSGSNWKKGELYLVMFTQEATNVPSYALESRIRYIDN